MCDFAAIPGVGLSVGVLGTVLIQSSTTTTAIAVSAVGSGVLPLRGAIPIILGANVGTTVAGSEDPRRDAPELVCRALAALPARGPQAGSGCGPMPATAPGSSPAAPGACLACSTTTGISGWLIPSGPGPGWHSRDGTGMSERLA